MLQLRTDTNNLNLRSRCSVRFYLRGLSVRRTCGSTNPVPSMLPVDSLLFEADSDSPTICLQSLVNAALIDPVFAGRRVGKVIRANLDQA
jgi:hypothetical protein